MMFEKKKRNTPTVTLIKNYQNTSGGKVGEARKEIKRRFEHLDWSAQKKIILLFLQSGESDRDWACRKLNRYWDKSFETIVKELWESGQEKKLTAAIIRYFPVCYLKQHFKTLSESKYYYGLCLRLWNDKDFVYDEARLMEQDVLRLAYTYEQSITDEKARDLLYTLIYKMCIGVYSLDTMGIEIMYNYHTDRVMPGGDFACLLTSDVIKFAIDYLHKLGKQKIVYEFYRWEQEVMAEIFDNESNHIDVGFGDSALYKKVKTGMYAVLRRVCYKHLDPKYKHRDEIIDFRNVSTQVQGEQEPYLPGDDEITTHTSEITEEDMDKIEKFLKRMEQKNPNINQLVRRLKLEPTELPF